MSPFARCCRVLWVDMGQSLLNFLYILFFSKRKSVNSRVWLKTCINPHPSVDFTNQFVQVRWLAVVLKVSLAISIIFQLRTSFMCTIFWHNFTKSISGFSIYGSKIAMLWHHGWNSQKFKRKCFKINVTFRSKF